MSYLNKKRICEEHETNSRKWIREYINQLQIILLFEID